MVKSPLPKDFEYPINRKPLSDAIVKKLTEAGVNLKEFEANRQRLTDEIEGRERVFTSTMFSHIPYLKYMKELSDSKFYGSFLHPKKGPNPSIVGGKYENIPELKDFHPGTEVELLEVKFYKTNNKWNVPAGCEICFPFQEGIVPIIGGVYIGGRKLTDKELERHGLSVVRDDQGKPFKYFTFATGGRSGLIPGDFSVYVLPEGKGFRLIKSSDELRQIANDKLGNEVMKGLRDLIEGEHAKVTEENRKKAADMGVNIDKSLKSLPEGPPELLYDLVFVRLLKERGILEERKVVGIQLKGLGGKYRFRITKEPAEGEVEVDIPDPAAKKLGYKYVKKPELEGAEGIQVDVNYDPGIPRPLGAAHRKERLERERDRILALKGAVLSGMTIGDIKLLDQNQVPELTVDQIGVTCRIVFDDTRRVGLFQMDPIKGSFHYRQYLRERYDHFDPDDKLERERDEHMTLFSRNIGTNMRALLDSNLTVPHDQLLVWNVSTVGGLTDTTCYSELKNPKNAMSMVVGFLRMVDDMYYYSGRAWEEKEGGFFMSKHFKELVSSFLGEDAADKISSEASRELGTEGYGGDMFHRKSFLIKISGMLTDEWLKSKGYGGKPEFKSVWQMWDSQVLKKLEQDPEMMKECDFKPSLVSLFKKMLKQPAGSGIFIQDDDILGLPRKLGVVDMMQYIRVKMDSHERYLSGMSMEETQRSQYEQYQLEKSA